MYYGNIKKCDIANGIGVRVSLFVSGCTNRCKGCFQPETWDFCYGKKYLLSGTAAEVLIEDRDKTVIFSRNRYGNLNKNSYPLSGAGFL